MGKLLAEHYPVAKLAFEEADETLGFRFRTLCFEGPEDELKKTENTQPALLTVSVAALRVLRGRLHAASSRVTVWANTRRLWRQIV